MFLTGTGDRITGKVAIRALFRTAPETNASKLSVRSITKEESGNLAYDSGSYHEMTTPGAGGTKRELQGNYVIVFRRQNDGRWLIAQHVWTEGAAKS